MNSTDIIFMPRVTDGVLADSNLGINNVLINASTVAGMPGVYQKISEAASFLIVDPETDQLMLPTKKASFNKLPYAAVDARKLYSDPEYRLSDLVIPALDFQRERNIDVLSSPYLAYEHFNTEFFNVSMALVNETIRNAKAANKQAKINVMVCPKSQALHNLQEVSFIAARYSEDFKDDIDYYTVKVDGLSDKDASVEELLGLARLVHELSWTAPVIVNPVGGFGLVLSVAGASYIVSSWRGSEAYTTQNGMRRRPSTRVYYPPILNYLDINELRSLGYKCNCETCKNSLPENHESITKHKIVALRDQYKELSKLTGQSRVDFVKKKYANAQTELNALGIKKMGPKNATYINKWSAVLDEVAGWSNEPDEDLELDKLLEEIDKND